MQDVLSTELEADLARLEGSIRQLKIQYDMFFAGAIPKQPLELRAEIERLIKRYTNAQVRKYSARFHFNSLVSRFNSLTELWSKTLRSLEEGDRPAPAVADRAGRDENLVARCTLKDGQQDRDSLKLLHARMVEARRKIGEEDAKLSLDRFIRGINAQAQKLREKTGCDRVELRVVVQDRKIVVKARPGR